MQLFWDSSPTRVAFKFCFPCMCRSGTSGYCTGSLISHSMKSYNSVRGNRSYQRSLNHQVLKEGIAIDIESYFQVGFEGLHSHTPLYTTAPIAKHLYYILQFSLQNFLSMAHGTLVGVVCTQILASRCPPVALWPNQERIRHECMLQYEESFFHWISNATSVTLSLYLAKQTTYILYTCIHTLYR